MIPRLTMQLTIIVAALLQGFLSMGFQLVATRVVAPFFGATLIVWAFVISTFLAAFSAGAFVGGACSRLGGAAIERSMQAIGLAGVAGFVVNAEFGHALLSVIDRHVHSLAVGLGLACVVLFLLPVAALSAMLPIFTEVLVKGGNRSGVSTGLIYGVSTMGNILGVMTTAFLLIPRLHTTTMLAGWAVAAAICFTLFGAAVKIVLAYGAGAGWRGLAGDAVGSERRAGP
jgi:hypothetical protein